MRKFKSPATVERRILCTRRCKVVHCGRTTVTSWTWSSISRNRLESRNVWMNTSEDMLQEPFDTLSLWRIRNRHRKALDICKSNELCSSRGFRRSMAIGTIANTRLTSRSGIVANREQRLDIHIYSVTICIESDNLRARIIAQVQATRVPSLILLPSISTDKVKFIGSFRNPESPPILVSSRWNGLSSNERCFGHGLEVCRLDDVDFNMRPSRWPGMLTPLEILR